MKIRLHFKQELLSTSSKVFLESDLKYFQFYNINGLDLLNIGMEGLWIFYLSGSVLEVQGKHMMEGRVPRVSYILMLYADVGGEVACFFMAD